MTSNDVIPVSEKDLVLLAYWWGYLMEESAVNRISRTDDEIDRLLHEHLKDYEGSPFSDIRAIKVIAGVVCETYDKMLPDALPPRNYPAYVLEALCGGAIVLGTVAMRHSAKLVSGFFNSLVSRASMLGMPIPQAVGKTIVNLQRCVDGLKQGGVDAPFVLPFEGVTLTPELLSGDPKKVERIVERILPDVMKIAVIIPPSNPPRAGKPN